LSRSRPLEANAKAKPQPAAPGDLVEAKNGSPAARPDGMAASLDNSALDNLLAVLGGEFIYLEELIDSFLEDAPKLLGELERSVEAGQAEGVRRVAHSLKSNGMDFGAVKFASLCKELEMVGNSGVLDNAQSLTAQITAEYDNVAVALVAVKHRGSIDG
jgi:HPt (histidine-containing phosphotransfer) domain-containing protein